MKVVISADTWKSIDGVLSKSISGISQSSVFKKWGQEVGVTVLDFTEVEALGAANLIPHIPPKPDDVVSLIYTSGTTGHPKAWVRSVACGSRR